MQEISYQLKLFMQFPLFHITYSKYVLKICILQCTYGTVIR